VPFAGRIEEQYEPVLENDPAAPLAGLPVREALTRFGEQSLRTVYASETLALHRIVLAEVNRFPELRVLFYLSGPERNIAALAYYLQTLTEDGRLTVRGPRKPRGNFSSLCGGTCT